MSIQEISEKFKRFGEDSGLFIALILILSAVISFALGRLSVGDGASSPVPRIVEKGSTAGVVVPEQRELQIETSQAVGEAEEGNYVASKNGKKYHLPWCSGAKQMNEDNKIWFATKAEAEAAGYTPAANCKGI